MYYPDRNRFKETARSHSLVPIYREIIADVDTPVSAFLKLSGSQNAFLLESVEGGERLGRYSFIGVDPYLVLALKEGRVRWFGDGFEHEEQVSDPLAAIKAVMSGYRLAEIPGSPPFYGGAVGFAGYDVVRYFEDIPKDAEDDLGLPEMMFMFTDTIVMFDHIKHRIRVIADARHQASSLRDLKGDGKRRPPLAELGDLDELYDSAVSKIEDLIGRLKQPMAFPALGEAGEDSLDVESNMSKERFFEMVATAKDYIRAGDALQIVLSQRFSAPIKSDPFNLYRVLRTINPSPYMYFLKFGELSLVGSSPEPLVKATGRTAVTRPIAGTRRRGENKEEDAELEEELMSDEKERAEHIMLVDLGRNDIGRVAEPGSVRVEDLMFVEKYSHVMHIVSNVVGRLRKDRDGFDLLRAAFPAGTVSGAPKIRAMEIIDELEPTLRGPYAGVVGYFSYSGDLDTCITIRTIVTHEGQAYVQAGAGIVYDSKPELEYKEIVNKAQAMLRAIQGAEARVGVD
ncbi:MAG: anthranilate synthase component I [Terriglobia bacterium]